MKFRINRISKAFIVFIGYILCYLLSSFVAAVMVTGNVKDYFLFNTSVASGLIALILVLAITKLYAASYSYVGLRELLKIAFMALVILAVNLVVSAFDENVSVVYAIVCFFAFFTFTTGMASSYRLCYMAKARIARSSAGGKRRVLIIGAGDAGASIVREMQSTDKIYYKPVGFIDDDLRKHGLFVSGVKVVGSSAELAEQVKLTGAELIIIAIPSADAKTVKRLTELSLSTGCEVKALPGIYQLLNGKVSVSHIRNVDVQDLLGRDPVKVNLDEVMGYIEDKTVLVTGGGGSIGSELCRQIATHNPRHLIILDIYENNAYDIEQELKRNIPSLKLTTLIASIRDSSKMDSVFATYRPEIVFHAAAHKHVPLMETSPCEAVKNNVFGTYNLAHCADKYGVKKFVQISTDKAVNPTNVMGATKRLCEMIIQSFSRRSNTCFVAVRFGNVLGSNGSVIPLFKKQIAEGGPVTVTHKDIIRYFMTIPEAVSLVLQAGAYAEGGEIFVLDMGEQVRIYDLAQNLIRLMGYEPEKEIEIKITGLRPGEKLYEERLMAEEGLTKTANDRISIGKPIVFDDESFLASLEELRAAALAESPQMKLIVRRLVPTYHPDQASDELQTVKANKV